MAVALIGEKVTKKDIKKASQEYGDFIKVGIDIKTGLMTIGGEWHADGEKILIQNGSQQKDIWGGGVNLKSKIVSYTSLINIRPDINPSQVIMDNKIRMRFEEILKEKFDI